MESVKACPGVANSLGTPRSAERRGVSYLINHPSENGQTDRMMKDRQRRPTVGGRVNCRVKCFYETRNHGPQDQDFDVILI